MQLRTMINIVAIALVLSSIAAAGIWSPAPEKKQSNTYRQDTQVVTEGHRLIVVEYERQIPRVDGVETAGRLDTAHKLIDEAAELIPDVKVDSDEERSRLHSAKEMICDAYGRCKDKLSSVVGKGREKLYEKAVDIEEGAKDEAREFVDTASRVVKNAKEKSSELNEDVKNRAKDVVESVVDKASKVKDEAIDKVSRAKEGAKGAVDSAANKASKLKNDAVETTEQGKKVFRKAEERIEKKTGELRGNLPEIFRRTREVLVDAAEYAWSPETGHSVASVLRLLGLATAYGTCVWVTFVSSHVLATALPRQQFGVVQSKLYPVYFRAMAYGVAATLLGHFYSRDRRQLGDKIQSYNLLAAFAMVVLNMQCLEPKATKVMFERIKMEKEEGRGQDMADVIVQQAAVKTSTVEATMQRRETVDGVAKAAVCIDQNSSKSRMLKLNKSLRMLNNYSSMLNVVSLMSLTWHLLHVAKQSQISC